jgi:hypothetical protein
MVAVGTPPTSRPAKVSEQTAPKLGAELAGVKGDYVVMPFDDWTMQGDTDADFMPNLYSSMSPTIHNLKAVVYKKDRLPVMVTPGEMQIEYSAASKSQRSRRHRLHQLHQPKLAAGDQHRYILWLYMDSGVFRQAVPTQTSIISIKHLASEAQC